MLNSIDSIKHYIQSVRLQLIRTEFILGFIKLNLILLPILLIFISLETVYYLDTFYRSKMMGIVSIIALTGYLYIILRYLINRYQLFGNMDDEYIARYIGHRSDLISDKILNALQLENNKLIGSNDTSLIQYALDRMKKKLDSISVDSIRQNVSSILYRYLLVGVICIIGIISINTSSMIPGISRLFNPTTEYLVPLPFTLVSMTGTAFSNAKHTIADAVYSTTPGSKRRFLISFGNSPLNSSIIIFAERNKFIARLLYPNPDHDLITSDTFDRLKNSRVGNFSIKSINLGITLET